MTTATATLPRGAADATVEALWPTPHPHAEDPVGWNRARRGGYLWSKQREIAESVRDNRYTAVHSAHDMGKSYVAAAILAWFADVNKPEKPSNVALVWTAPTYKQVAAIMSKELRAAHKQAGLPGRIGLNNEWLIGDQLVGFGRKPADHDPAAFQGIHARHVLVVIDEACGVPKALFDAVDALATNEHARVLAIGNPDDPESHFAKVCEPGSDEGKGWNVIHVDGLKSPNFSGEWVPDDLRPMLLSPTWVQERRERWGEDSAIFEAKVRGRFSRKGSGSVIAYALVARARRRDPVDPAPGKPLGGVLGCDIARSENGDMNTMVAAHRGRAWVVKQWHEADTMKVAAEIEAAVKGKSEHDGVGGPNWKAHVDGDGVGGGVVDKLRLDGVNVVEFRGSKTAKHRPTRYANRRAEAWASARDQLRDGLWALPPDGDKIGDELAADLSVPKRMKDASGRLLVEPKDAIQKRLGRSPDLGDAFVMAVCLRPDTVSPGATRPAPPPGRQRVASPAAGVMDEPLY